VIKKKEEAKGQKYKPENVGEVVKGKIDKIDKATGLRIRLDNGQFGMVFLTEISDDFQPDPTAKFTQKQALECTILKVNPEK
jgi:ribosomal protein S1